MSFKSRRLRRRSQAYPGDSDEQPVEGMEEVQFSPRDNNGTNGTEELSDEQRKKLEVWDAFKEENHEVLEQLPLSLNRQFKLIRELDTQNEGGTSVINATTGHSQGGINPDNQPGDPDCPSEVLGDGGNDAGINPTSRTQDSLFQPKPGETTQSILQHIAQVSEESLRAAEEKVSIAQTAYETVDRHIRLLDQAIKEQEAAISLGMRPGTHLAPILLPDIVAVPRWARPSRVEHSPLALTPEPDLPPVNEVTINEEVAAVPSPPPIKKGKKVILHEPVVTDEVAVPAETPRPRRGIKLTIPAQPVPEGPPISADPNERKYCYCNQVSFGTVGVTIVAVDGRANSLTTPTPKMIACDNENCKLEWFHLGCTGLSELPGKKSKWYCRDCKPKMGHKGRQRT
ncbi:hypothetical protein ID866_1502 [Astraeus odoratus]|nr:hypothetical protein ID866_1502 [Astraeus odoratus]